jgi:hypothetical protein
MVTDRITLNLIALYLDQFQQNQGTIDSIEISKVTKSFGSPKSLASFQDLRSFKQFVNQNAPLVTTEEIECFPLSLYELKSFNVTIDLGTSTSSKNFVINNNRTFQTDSKNIASANMIIMQEYVKEFLAVLKQFNDLIIDEYIQDQYTYIDCGYIEVHFNAAMDRILELYKKYK